MATDSAPNSRGSISPRGDQDPGARVQLIGGASLFDIPSDFTSLFEAVLEGRYVIAFQPIFERSSGRLSYLEAILHLPSLYSAHSDRNLEIASRNGMIVGLGQEVIWETCKVVRELRTLGWPGLIGSVNLAGIQLLQPGLVAEFQRSAEEWGLPLSALQVEVPYAVYQRHAGALRLLRGANIRVGVEVAPGRPLPSIWRLMPQPAFVKVPVHKIVDNAARRRVLDYSRWKSLVRRAGIQILASHIERTCHHDVAVAMDVDYVQGRYLLREARGDDIVGLAVARELRIRRRSARRGTIPWGFSPTVGRCGRVGTAESFRIFR